MISVIVEIKKLEGTQIKIERVLKQTLKPNRNIKQVLNCIFYEQDLTKCKLVRLSTMQHFI